MNISINSTHSVLNCLYKPIPNRGRPEDRQKKRKKTDRKKGKKQTDKKNNKQEEKKQKYKQKKTDGQKETI